VLIGPLQFDSPWWLLLFPVGAALVLLAARRSLSGLGPVSNISAITLRLLALLLASAALAEPSYRLTSKAITVIVVSDQSRSMPPAVHTVFGEFLSTAVQSAPAEAGLAYITTAQEPRVQLLPSRNVTAADRFRGDIAGTTFDPGPTEGTNLEQAVRLALAIKPDDSAARVTVISDGNETDGSLLAAAESLKSAGVPLDAMELDKAGLNTGLTARNVSKLAKEQKLKRILAVSHFYHLPRGKMSLQRENLQTFTVPAKESYTLRKMPVLIAREVVAVWAYYLRPLVNE